MPTFTVIKRDASGDFALSYQGELRRRGADFVCLDARFEQDDRDLGYIQLRRGDAFREWFFAERWFNIFRVCDGASGALKGWYCNITRPPVFTPTSVAAEDLALDVFVYPDGRTLLLDEDEFARLDLPRRERENAWQAVATILEMARARQAPFDEIDAGLADGERPSPLTPDRGG